MERAIVQNDNATAATSQTPKEDAEDLELFEEVMNFLPGSARMNVEPESHKITKE